VTPAEIVVTAVMGLAVNESCEISPWAARKLVIWSAHRRYAGNPERTEIRAAELAALIDARPGKLFKLLTACGFAAAAFCSQLMALLRRTAKADSGTADAAIQERAVAAFDAAAAMDVALAVHRAAEGDQQAWEWLVDRYSRLVWAMTHDFKLSREDASSVAQATWLRLLAHIDRIERPAGVGAWLAATARDECLRTLAS
jgi:Sigma-70 region 2